MLPHVAKHSELDFLYIIIHISKCSLTFLFSATVTGDGTVEETFTCYRLEKQFILLHVWWFCIISTTKRKDIIRNTQTASDGEFEEIRI